MSISSYLQVQAMRKCAAEFPWKNWFTNIGSSLGIGRQKRADSVSPQGEKTRSQAFHDLNSRPYDTAKEFETQGFDPASAGDKAYTGSLPNTYRSYGNPDAGRISYTYSSSDTTNNSNGPGWNYKIYKTSPGGDDYNEANAINFTVYPEQLPSYRYGKSLNEATAGYRQQPLNTQQLMAIQAGDAAYTDKLLAHYRSIDPASWQAANLKLSSPDVVKRWLESVPRLAPAADRSSNYSSGDDVIRLAPNDIRLDNYDSYVGNAGDGLTSNPRFVANPSRAFDALFRSGYISEAADADTFFHELNHRNSLGSTRVFEGVEPHVENIPVDSGGIAALMQPEKYKGLYLTPMQIKWLYDHDLESYAVNENEINQALLSFNAGRYRLQKDMQDNPSNPNYVQIDPAVRQQFLDLPQFIQPGEAGAKQLDELMSFYDKNPQFILMMPEQARLVGYYKNLKAAVETSQDSTEKEFFQGMMNRMLYNKAFLAEHQGRPKMSYTNVQQMRA